MLSSKLNQHINNIFKLMLNNDKNLDLEIKYLIDTCIYLHKQWLQEYTIQVHLLLVKEFPLAFNKNQLIDIHNILLHIEAQNNNNIQVKMVHLFFNGIIQNFEKGLKYFLLNDISKNDGKINIKYLNILYQAISSGYQNNIRINLTDKEYNIVVSYCLEIIDSNEFLQWDINHQFSFLTSINQLFMLERPFIFKKLGNSLGKLFNIYLNSIENNPFVFMSLYDGFRMLFWKSRVGFYRYVIAFNEMMSKPYVQYMDKYHKKFNHLKRLKKPKKIKNVCYMLTNTYCSPGYAPAYTLKNIHKAHHKYGSHDVKIYVYSIGGFDRDVNYEYKKCLENCNITIREFPSLSNHDIYLNILEFANKDDIDLAIMNMNFSTQVFLFSAQIAPYQIYQNHGFSAFNPSNIDNHIWLDNELIPDYLQEYVETNNYPITVLNYSQYYDKNIGQMNKDLETKKEKELLKYPKDKIILGNMQSLERINSEFLDIVVEILLNNRNAIFICCGSGDTSLIKMYIDKYKLQDQFFTPGFVEPHLYGHIIDIVMNTPMSSGLSILDFLNKGKIVISMPKDRIKPIALETIGLVIDSAKEYIQCVTKLINDKDFYKKTKKQVHNSFKDYTSSPSGVQNFEALLFKISK